MKTVPVKVSSGTGRRRVGTFLRAVLSLTAAGILATAPLSGQVSGYGDKVEGTSHGDELPTVLQRVQVAQHLNAQLPLGASFVDESGKSVTLGSYFDGKHPAILALVYYNCPMLCSEEMDGLTSALEMVRLQPGKDFQIVVVSIDPSEGPHHLSLTVLVRYRSLRST